MIFMVDRRSDLFYLPVGICWSAVKNGRHADSWYRARRDAGVAAVDECVSAGPANAPDVWNFGLFSIEEVGYRAQVIRKALLAGAGAWVLLKRG